MVMIKEEVRKVCYDDGDLRAYLDSELDRQKSWEMELHLAKCRECQEVLDELKMQDEMVSSTIEDYRHATRDFVSNKGVAWQRFLEKHEKGNKKRFWRGVDQLMRSYAKIAALAVAFILLAVLLSFGSVRSSIAGLLGIFRVNQIETVDVSPKDLAQIEQAMKNGGEDIDIRNFGKISVNGSEETRIVSREEAQKAADFSLKIPNGPVAQYGAPTIRMQSAMDVKIALDVTKVNSLIGSLGGSKLLPAAMDGKTFTLNVPTMIRAEYPAADQAARPLTIGQARSPEIKVPDEVDVEEIRDALLDIQILPDQFRKKLAAVDDWQHTLLVPNIDGSTQKVVVNGNDGVFVSSPKERNWGGSSAALIWLQDGVINVVEGGITLDDAMAIASLMK
jgi:hypothetical protein